jgi:hypothetical protein
METENSISISELLKKAEAMSEIDLGRAIAILQDHSRSNFFSPWGSLSLIRLLRRAGQKSEWRSWSTQLFDAQPEFVAGWQHRLDCCLSRSEFDGVASQILVHIKANFPRVPWIRGTLIEVLFAVDQDEKAQVLQNATNAGIIEKNTVGRIQALLQIISEIRSANHEAVTGATAWCYSFCGSDRPALVRIDNLVCVNLSRLNLDAIDDGEKELAPHFFRLCQRLVNELPYHDDTGINSFSKVTAEDLGSVYFWLLLKARASSSEGYRRTMIPEMRIKPGQLWYRIGNVEAWALSSYLFDKEACLDAADAAALALGDAAHDSDEVNPKSEWWPRTNSLENILRLSTNAGWYANPDSGRAAFDDWAQRYLGAMHAGHAISTCNEEMLKLATRCSELSGLQPSTWTERAFFEAIDGRSVLLVSPFAAQITSQFASGALHRIWAAQGITARLRSLETIEPPMSIWPYRPDNDWSESFSHIEEKCLDRLDKGGADFFIASCGCYGLPLVHSINRMTNTTSIYFGHVVNMYFGILTQAYLQSKWFTNAPSELFVSGDLDSRFGAIGRIDAGRYASSQGVPR